MKVLVLGTSNTLLKAGWVAGLTAALPDGAVERRGVGGYPIPQFATEAGEDFTRFDAVVIDTLANDEIYALDAETLSYFTRIALDICATIAAQTCLIIYALSERSFINVASPQRDAWRDIARRCGGQYVDVNALLSVSGIDYLEPGTDLYETHAHPRQELAWAVGHSLGVALRSASASSLPISSRADRFVVVDATTLPHEGEVINRRNSLFDIDFVRLQKGQSLALPLVSTSAPAPVVGFYTSRHESDAVIRLESGAHSIVWACENRFAANRFIVGFALVPPGIAADRIVVLSGQVLLSRIAFWRGEGRPLPIADLAEHDPSALHRVVAGHLAQRLAERQAARRARLAGHDHTTLMTLAHYDPGMLRRLADDWMATDAAQTLSALRRYTELVPTDPTGFIALARAYSQGGDTAQALTILEGADRYRPHNDGVVGERINLLYALGRPDDALALCQALIRSQPLSARAWELLVRVTLRVGDKAGYKAARLQVAQLRSENAQAQLAVADIFEGEKDFVEAAFWLRRCCALEPTDMKVQFRLGRALAATGDHAGAVVAFRAAIAINPELGAARFLLEQSIAAGGDAPMVTAAPPSDVSQSIIDEPIETDPPASVSSSVGAQSSWFRRQFASLRLAPQYRSRR